MALRTPLVMLDATDVALPSGDNVRGDIGLVTLNQGVDNIELKLTNSWKLDEWTGIRRASVGDNDLADINNVGVTTGKITYAAKFDYLMQNALNCDHGDGLSIKDSEDWQATLWVKIYDNRKLTYILDKALSTVYLEYFLHYPPTDGKFRFTVTCDGGNATVHSDTFGAAINNTWVMISIRYAHASSEIGININNTGWDVSTVTGALPVSPEHTFRIGGLTPLWGNLAVDAVHIWGRLLSDAELAYMYNSGDGRQLVGFGLLPFKCLPVCTIDNKKMQPAIASTLAQSEVVGLVLDPDNGIVQTCGTLEATTDEWDVVTGGSGGLTPNTEYFLKSTLSALGVITATPPTTPSRYVVRLGAAVSETKFNINIKRPIRI